MREAPDLEAAMTRAIEDLYPTDASTGLRIYNPDGQRVVDITEPLEITYVETYSDRGEDRSGPPENRGTRDEAPQDDAQRPRRGGVARPPRRVRVGTAFEGHPEGAAVKDR